METDLPCEGVIAWLNDETVDGRVLTHLERAESPPLPIMVTAVGDLYDSMVPIGVVNAWTIQSDGSVFVHGRVDPLRIPAALVVTADADELVVGAEAGIDITSSATDRVCRITGRLRYVHIGPRPAWPSARLHLSRR